MSDSYNQYNLVRHIESADVATRKVLFEKTKKPVLLWGSISLTGITSGYVYAPYVSAQLVEPVYSTAYTGTTTPILSRYAVMSGATNLSSLLTTTANTSYYSTIKIE
jgi:hypothetical protein